MAGLNPQLVLGPSLQMYFVDKDTGLPLAGGEVFFWEDNARTIPKDVYTISGTPPNYIYTALPNPVTLSAVGTIQDGSGNDVLPYYYPFVGTPDNPSTTPDLYYIEVKDSSGVLQFTREGWPNTTSGSIPGVTVDSLDNYIVNNVFWRNLGTNSNVSNELATTVCPGAHAGFSMPDVQYVKNIIGATETISFPPITPPFDQAAVPYPEPTPEFCFNLTCTGAVVGETSKALQFPISLHIETLSDQTGTLTFWAKAGSVSANNTIQPYIYQFTGTGASVQPAPIAQGAPIELTAGWVKYFVPITFPNSAGVSISTAGDDALYMQIGLPLSVTCNVSIAKPCLYLGTSVPTNEFDTYDHINSIVDSARTGDVRMGMSNFGDNYGWVPLDDGTIGDSSSNATTRKNVDAWPLFNLLWTYGNVGGFAQFLPIFDSAGMSSVYGGSAYLDWAAHKQIQLPYMSGRVIGGGIPDPITMAFTSSSNTLTLTFGVYNNNQVYVGAPVHLTVTGGSSTLTTGVYFLTNLGGSPFGQTCQLATTFVSAINGTNITFTNTPSGNIEVNPVSATIGENSHTLLQPELPNVNLNLTGGIIPTFAPHSTGGNNGSIAAGDNSTNQGSVGTNNGVVPLGGSARPFNINQFTTFMNMFMKL